MREWLGLVAGATLMGAALTPSPTWGGEASAAFVLADSIPLVADGISSTPLTLWVVDQFGSPVPDGTLLPLETSLGTLLSLTPTQGGVATATFQAGTWADTAVLDAGAVQLYGDTSLPLESGEVVSLAMHLHGSFSEGSSTMTGHTLEGAEQGVDVMWWTDHDITYYPDRLTEDTGFDFEEGTLARRIAGWPSDQTLSMEWGVDENLFTTYVSRVVGAARRSGNYGWRLRGYAQGSEDWLNLSYIHSSTNSMVHAKPAMGELQFGFSFRPTYRVSPDAELWVTVELSAGLDGELNRIHFYHSAHFYEGNEDEHNHYQRLEGGRGAWTSVTANISDLTREFFPELGDDQRARFCSVQIRAKGTAIAAYDLDDFWWSQDTVGDELREIQRAFLDGLGLGPSHLVGQEISRFSSIQHLNAFGSAAPFLPYAENQEMTLSDGVSLLHDYSALVSYNHMFGVGNDLFDDEKRAAQVVSVIDKLLSSQVYGCDLLEVGYRQRGGGLSDFMEVWDALSQEGIFITGISGNDQHAQTDWDTMSNNLVTWVETASEVEEDLLWSLGRGAAWFGDPTLFPEGHVRASLKSLTSRATQGQVVVGETIPQDLRFEADPLTAGWQLRVVENGVPTLEQEILSDGPFSFDFTIDPASGNTVRIEVVNDSGPILYTNPLYFLESTEEAIVPCRLPDP